MSPLHHRAQPLFRREAVVAEQRVYGSVIVTQPISAYVISAFCLAFIAALAAFLVWGRYARKETVQGYLVPTHGVAQVFPRSGGVVAAVHVAEGEPVHVDQRLLTIEWEVTTAQGRRTVEESVSLLDGQISSLEKQIARQRERMGVEQRRLAATQLGLKQELEALGRQQRLAAEGLELANSSLARAEVVRPLVAESAYDSERSQYLSARQRSAAIGEKLAQQRTLLERTTYEAELLPFQVAEAVDSLQQQLSGLRQRRLELEGKGSYDLRATVDGVASAISAVVGSAVDPNTPVMAILPRDSQLEANLFVPTSAIGFVERGQRVRVLYDAFPYQQFGTHGGVIDEVSKTVLSVGQTPIPVASRQPVYRARVRLDGQHVFAYGDDHPLQSGMLLRADILLRERRLWQWLIEPLLRVRGRLD